MKISPAFSKKDSVEILVQKLLFKYTMFVPQQNNKTAKGKSCYILKTSQFLFLKKKLCTKKGELTCNFFLIHFLFLFKCGRMHVSQTPFHDHSFLIQLPKLYPNQGTTIKMSQRSL